MATIKAPPAPKAQRPGTAPNNRVKERNDDAPSPEGEDEEKGEWGRGSSGAERTLSPSASSGGPGLPQTSGGGGDYGSSFTSAMSGIVSLTAWVLDYLWRIFEALVLAPVRWVLGMAAKLLGALGKFLVRRSMRAASRSWTRRKIKSRLKRAGKAREAADQALEKVKERAASSVSAAEAARARLVGAAQQARGAHLLSVAAQGNRAVRAAEARRDQRVSAIRHRGDRVVAAAQRAGDSRVRAAKWDRAAQIRAAEKKGDTLVENARARREQLIEKARKRGNGSGTEIAKARRAGNTAVKWARQKRTALVRQATRNGDTAVRKAETDSAQHVQKVQARVNGVVAAGVDRVRQAGDQEVRAAELSRVQNFVQAGKLGDVLVRQAEHEGDRYVQDAKNQGAQAVQAAEAAHTRYTAQLDYREAALKDQADNYRSLSKEENKKSLRADGKEASQQRQAFDREIRAAAVSIQPPQAAPVRTGNQANQANPGQAQAQAPAAQAGPQHANLRNTTGRGWRRVLGRGSQKSRAATAAHRQRQSQNRARVNAP